MVRTFMCEECGHQWLEPNRGRLHHTCSLCRGQGLTPSAAMSKIKKRQQKQAKEQSTSNIRYTSSSSEEYSLGSLIFGGGVILIFVISRDAFNILPRVSTWYESNKMAIWITGGVIGGLLSLYWLGSRDLEKQSSISIDDVDDLPKEDDVKSEEKEKSTDTNPTDRWVSTDPFFILGLSSSSDANEVKQAYHALIAQYHPDKVSSLAPEFQKLANERSKKINWAYSECLKTAPIIKESPQSAEPNPRKEESKGKAAAHADNIISINKSKDVADKLTWIWKFPLFSSLFVSLGLLGLMTLSENKTSDAIAGLVLVLILFNLFVTLPALYLSRFIRRISQKSTAMKHQIYQDKESPKKTAA